MDVNGASQAHDHKQSAAGSHKQSRNQTSKPIFFTPTQQDNKSKARTKAADATEQKTLQEHNKKRTSM